MKITQEMLNAAMKKAVALEIIPKHSDETTYLKYWEGMKKVLESAVNKIDSPTTHTDDMDVFSDYPKID